MQVEFIVNGGVSLLLAPENDSEEALIKQLVKQQNDITEIRSSVVVLNKTFKNGLLISKKLVNKSIIEEQADDSGKEEIV
jgi:hypothetical protein